MDEVAPRDTRNTPAQRTIQEDIRIMRSDILGYNAPIEIKNGRYFYNESDYSIKNASLTKDDLRAITTAAKVLGQYKGFNFFNDLNNVWWR